MKLCDIMEKEELEIDSEKLRKHAANKGKYFNDLINQFIGNMNLNDDEMRILYKYNEFLRENYKQL